MAKNRIRTKQTKTDASPAALARADGWQNVLTGLGTARDKRTHAQFGGALLFQGGQELDELYAGDDVIARIVDLPAQEMTREWIELRAGEEEAGVAKDLAQRLDDLDLQSATAEALTWARLHGGALMILGVDDGQDPDQPLNEEAIRSFRWVTVVDRWDVTVAQRYRDPHSPRFGKPERYKIRPTSEGGGVSEEMRVHESRVIRFDGVLTPKRRMARNQGWCDSIVSRVFEVARDFGQSYGGAAAALADFSQAVTKIQGLANMLAADQDDQVIKRIQLMDMMRSMVRLVPLDAERESFEIVTRTLTGMPDVLDRMAQRLAAATDIPVTRLMGMSPAGLNATGASDIRNWYDAIKAKQESTLRPRLGRIIQLVFRSDDGPTKGQEPENWSLEFRPLWQPTEKETAEVRYLVAQTDGAYLDRGVTDSAEVAVSRFGGDRYSMETTIDVEAREGIPPAEPGSPALPEPAPGVEPMQPAQAETVAESAMNGAQVAALVGVISSVAKREIPREAGVAAIRKAFQATPEEAEMLMGETGRTFFASSAPAEPAPAA